MVFCVLCNQLVLKTSYHCWKCSKCINNIDHHCKYLNCCIANDNYIAFLRLLTIFILYSLDYIFLLIVFAKENVSLSDKISLFLTLSEVILVTSLFVFHIYLNCIAKMRTHEFVERMQGGRTR